MMDEQLKQRLVGAIVLVALGVIFIPMLLDGDPNRNAQGQAIPEKPERVRKAFSIAPKVESKPEVVKPKAATAKPKYQVVEVSPDQQPKPEVSKPTPAPKPKPKSERIGDPKNDARMSAWDVQVASLSKAAYANELRDKLRAKGYPTFIEKVGGGSKTIYRVRIGPVLNRAKAERILAEVQRGFKLKGLVTQHDYKK